MIVSTTTQHHLKSQPGQRWVSRRPAQWSGKRTCLLLPRGSPIDVERRSGQSSPPSSRTSRRPPPPWPRRRRDDAAASASRAAPRDPTRHVFHRADSRPVVPPRESSRRVESNFHCRRDATITATTMIMTVYRRWSTPCLVVRGFPPSPDVAMLPGRKWQE